MRNLVAITLLVVAVLAMPTQAQQTPNVVTPGQGIGGIKIGGPISEAIAQLGSLVDKSERGGYLVYDWPLRPLLVIAEKDTGKIVLILVQLSDAFLTTTEITAGSDRSTVEKAYGKEFSADENQRSTTIVYDTIGIAFDIGKHGVMQDRVTSIFVFMPGQWKKITGDL